MCAVTGFLYGLFVTFICITCGVLWGVYMIEQTSSKHRADVEQTSNRRRADVEQLERVF